MLNQLMAKMGHLRSRSRSWNLIFSQTNVNQRHQGVFKTHIAGPNPQNSFFRAGVGPRRSWSSNKFPGEVDVLIQGLTTLRTTLGHPFGAAGGSRKDTTKPYHKQMQERVWLLTVEQDLREDSWRGTKWSSFPQGFRLSPGNMIVSSLPWTPIKVIFL